MIASEYVGYSHIYTHIHAHIYIHTHIEEDSLGFWKLKISALLVGSWGYNTSNLKNRLSLRRSVCFACVCAEVGNSRQKCGHFGS